MSQRTLSSADVVLLIVVSVASHWFAGDDWTLAAISQRCGVVIPTALLGISWCRQIWNAIGEAF